MTPQRAFANFCADEQRQVFTDRPSSSDHHDCHILRYPSVDKLRLSIYIYTQEPRHTEICLFLSNAHISSGEFGKTVERISQWSLDRFLTGNFIKQRFESGVSKINGEKLVR